MKAWQITDTFGLEHLTCHDIPTPKAGKGELLIQMTAASLNYRDLVTVNGGYGKTVKPPLIPCSDGVGLIVECGPSSLKFNTGDRVCPIFFPNWQSGPAKPGNLPDALGGAFDGTLCEYMVASETACVLAPSNLNNEEAATLPCAGLTAWAALFEHTTLGKGDKLAIQGTGGVALFALAFAKAVGAEVIITSSSDQKLEKAKELGADHCINYSRTPDWAAEVKKIWPDGADHILELGGAKTLQQSIRAVRIGGQISLIGVLSGAVCPDIPLPLILMRNVRLQGVTVGSRDAFQRMNDFISKQNIKPIIDRSFAFNDVPKAFSHLKGATHFGKICVTF